ncbi:MAG: DedA family protein, partial [Proteobacteria bacterium]|nr:DedA family protein [Pseudomonadota bacterium]
MKLLIDLLAFIQPYGGWSYFVIFGVLLACGFGLPIPEDITLVTGGILAARHIIRFDYCVIVCMAGVMLGDSVIFILGQTMGHKVRGSRLGKWLLPEKRDAAVRGLV